MYFTNFFLMEPENNSSVHIPCPIHPSERIQRVDIAPLQVNNFTVSSVFLSKKVQLWFPKTEKRFLILSKQPLLFIHRTKRPLELWNRFHLSILTCFEVRLRNLSSSVNTLRMKKRKCQMYLTVYWRLWSR